jgi:nitrite reductase (cytochrome c-552)
MPYIRVGSYKLSDHHVTSPLKKDLKACMQCHAETKELLRDQVITIQDRTVSLMIRAGYATAVAAKLIEKVHDAQVSGKNIDQALYDKAKDCYLEAFYRSIYIGAENSVGFHNPTESMRILGDAVAFASKAEGLLRQALTKAGINVPLIVNLDIKKYLSARGKKKLTFDPNIVIHDPFGTEEKLVTVTLRQ